MKDLIDRSLLGEFLSGVKSLLSGKVDDTSAGVSAAINRLTVGGDTPTDADYYVCQYAGGGTSMTSYHRRPVSALWKYIKAKTDALYAAISHGHGDATQSAAGFMSAADKAKLDGLSGSGGDDALVLALLSDTRELEDLTIRTGSFANAGEGWNTFAFPEPFDAPPLVVARCEGYGVDVKGVTADRFLYMVTQATSSGASSRTLYAANSGGVVYATKPTASSTAFTVLTSAGSRGTEGTADAVTVRWAAFEKGE